MKHSEGMIVCHILKKKGSLGELISFPRRNVTPATFEADHANPRSKFPAFRSHHQYEMPLGTLPERDGII